MAQFCFRGKRPRQKGRGPVCLKGKMARPKKKHGTVIFNWERASDLFLEVSDETNRKLGWHEVNPGSPRRTAGRLSVSAVKTSLLLTSEIWRRQGLGK